jgi:hypothetical protein
MRRRSSDRRAFPVRSQTTCGVSLSCAIRHTAKSSSLVTITAPSRSALPNHPIRGGIHVQISDMFRRMAAGTQPPGKGRRQLRIDQEAHQATDNTGWSLCRAAYSRAATMSAGSKYG